MIATKSRTGFEVEIGALYLFRRGETTSKHANSIVMPIKLLDDERRPMWECMCSKSGKILFFEFLRIYDWEKLANS